MHCFLIENDLYESLSLSNTAAPTGTWQWDPGKPDKKFLDPCLLVVSFMFLKVQAFIFAWISIETDKTNTFRFPLVFLQFSFNFPLVFLQFLGLIETKTFLLQHFVETRAV